MTLTKISMPDAIRIEKIRRNGTEIGELLGNDNFAALGSELQSVFRDGYQIKFVTVNGLKNLLRIKFGKEAGSDFTETEQGLVGITLTDEEAAAVRQMLSPNCLFERETEETYKVLWS